MKNDLGFTLIELLITLVVSSLIVMAAYAANISQQKTYFAQEQVAQMQQNLRSALALVTSDIRMAGYDPTGSGNFKITFLHQNRLEMTSDLNGDGIVGGPDSGETTNYTFSGSCGNVMRQVDDQGAAESVIAKNIQDIHFEYLDENGNITAVPDNVRTIQVTILAKAGRSDQDYTNKTRYSAPSPSAQTWGPYNDHFRRRLLTTSIRCRNLGI